MTGGEYGLALLQIMTRFAFSRIVMNSHEVEKALTKAVHRLDLTTPEKIEKAVELLETSMICALDKSCQSVKQKE